MNKESLPRPLKKEESTSLTGQNNPEKNAASLVSPPFGGAGGGFRGGFTTLPSTPQSV